MFDSRDVWLISLTSSNQRQLSYEITYEPQLMLSRNTWRTIPWPVGTNHPTISQLRSWVLRRSTFLDSFPHRAWNSVAKQLPLDLNSPVIEEDNPHTYASELSSALTIVSATSQNRHTLINNGGTADEPRIRPPTSRQQQPRRPKNGNHGERRTWIFQHRSLNWKGELWEYVCHGSCLVQYLCIDLARSK